MHPHTSMPDDGFEVTADNSVQVLSIEAFAEKRPALAGRTPPPDLWDAGNSYRTIDVREEPSGVR
jgi:hypothetical protein